MLLHSSSSLCLQPSSTTAAPQPGLAPSSNSNSRSSLSSALPQPYGVIPRRRKAPLGRRSSTSTASSTATSSSAAAFSRRSSASSLELLPTKMNKDDQSKSIGTDSVTRESFFDYFQSGLWATIKAHCRNTSISINGSRKHSSTTSSITRTAGPRREFAPPVALMVSNSSPVVTLDPTPLVISPSSSSLSTDDALLFLPNIEALLSAPVPPRKGSSSSSIGHNALASGLYPVSVAAMDKFKIMRTDIIPLKTFTYRETLVEEAKSPASSPAAAAARATSSAALRSTPLPQLPLVKRSMPRPSPAVSSSACRSGCSTPVEAVMLDEAPLPRHLARREARSNPDFLRMMASELRMIRSRKLIAPLKPRGYLARRKDLFRNVKSSLCASMEMVDTRDENDHPLNSLLVGSWSSVSSTDSFLSANSSDYITAEEEDEDEL